MPVIDARDLRKAYGPREVLGGVDLSIDEGERIGLVGLNGSGKSTLARILAGLEQADDGSLTRRRDARIVYLPQTPGFDHDDTARGEALSGLQQWRRARERFDRLTAELEGGRADEALLADQASALADVERTGGFDVDHRAEAMLGKLGVDPEARLSTLSGGEQRRVALARTLLAAPDLAILDEPTNHLDLATIEWLESYLLDSFPGAVLLVTHDRAFLDRAAQRTAEIDLGKLYCYAGGYADFVRARAERLALEERVEANRQNFLRRELEWLRRQPKARTTKQKARIGRAHAVRDSGGARRERQVELRVDSVRLGKTILELKDLGVDTPDARPLVRGLDFMLTRGQRVGILGPNGCGKTTLLRAITGAAEPAAGEIVRGKNTRVSFLSQTREDLDESATIRDNVAEGRSTVRLGDQDVGLHAYLDRFLFSGADHLRPVSALSGGEKSRVALARMLAQPANLVILDEPTNDLDVATISALEELLIDFAGTALVVTHDRWFLNRVATAMLVFEGARRVVAYAGNYSAYRALADKQAAESKRAARRSSAEATRTAAATKPKRKKSGLTYAEELELAELEPRAEAAEARAATLEARLADPATYQEGSRRDIDALLSELEAAKAEAVRLLERWEELETRREG